MHAVSVAGRGRIAAVLTLLAGGSATAVPPLALLTPDGPAVLADLPRGEAARTAAWWPGTPGLKWTELELRGHGEARVIRVIAVRLDPTRFRLSLENGMAPGGFLQVWTLDLAPAHAALALNAGMFEGDGAWGWVVHEGTEYRVPRTGPLARAVVVDSSGAVRLLDDEAVRAVRAGGASTAGRADRADKAVEAVEVGPISPALPAAPALIAVKEAFQSYPLLLEHGELPAMLTAHEGGIDLRHRDARLALALDDKGQLLVALTRFDALGPSFGSVPFGLTIPETAWLMRALGAESAVGLDGGISAQLLLRDAAGEPHRWPGLRSVPLGLSAVSLGER